MKLPIPQEKIKKTGYDSYRAPPPFRDTARLYNEISPVRLVIDAFITVSFTSLITQPVF